MSTKPIAQDNRGPQPDQQQGPSPLAIFQADLARIDRLALDLFDGDQKRHLRFKAGTFQLVRKNPDLLDCNRASLMLALGECAALDLETSPTFQHVAIVPRKGEAQLMIQYRGLIALMIRSGFVEYVTPYVVRSGEVFRHTGGSEPRIVHELPLDDVDEGNEGILASYCMLKMRGSPGLVAGPVIRRTKLLEAKGRSNGNVWAEHFEAMCLKTAIRRAAKTIPQSEELAYVLTREDVVEGDVNARLPELDRLRELAEVIRAGDRPALRQGEEAPLLTQLGAGQG